MPGDHRFFLDAYALIEIALANPAYEPYLLEDLATSAIHRLEAHYHLLRIGGPEIADGTLAAFRPFEVDIVDDDIRQASGFRLGQRARGYSFADALGYTMAQRRGMRFLTGDKAFKGVKGVEFVR